MSQAAGLPPRWTAARQLLGNTNHAVSAEQVERVWSTLEQAVIGHPSRVDSPTLFDAVQQLVQSKSISSYTLDRLAGWEVGAFLDESAMRSNRERRLHAFSRLYDAVLATTPSSRRKAESAFLLGYVVSRMAPGTFEYSKLVSERAKEFPEILLWYGLCEGLVEDSRIHNLFGGLGSRVFRDVIAQRDIASRPICDIGLLELLTLVEAKSLHRLRISRQSTLIVEIMPLVECVVRTGLAHEQTKTGASTQQRDLGFSDDIPKPVDDALKALRIAVQNVLKNDSSSRGAKGAARKRRYPKK